ncbi:hypothetical protein GM661_11885 [Iocasia frigidifontis]|uniref:Transglutaminase-like domain-containing protein n=1 Tax=Iocasia fonsfrigidae TaxID=2682810 RepID=A0A8A7K9X9_9FIRM|nr:transglutaminase-like domain-containing protein [Iocasia fonsfrigidae]QTL98613.1 hypothetical protein GM661_11885 [Iocasia fonsfrigidae]
MKEKILNYYLQFSTYTNPGCYVDFLKSLTDDISELGNLITHQVIHRVTLKNGNTSANSDKKYGDMDRYPWHRLRCDDDVLLTSLAMVGELLRLDERGFKKDRAVEDKIVVTCRYVSVLMTSILKSKGVPTRCRSGFAPYLLPDISADHWINQYWSIKENRWINIDADGFFDDLDFSQFDIPDDEFDWAAKTWLDIRTGRKDSNKIVYAAGQHGLEAAIRAIFYDFHSLMNNEISYNFQPSYISGRFEQLTEKEFKEIDKLAKLMLEPDKNFEKLINVWNNEKKFRVLNSPLIGDNDHKSNT